jgi:predicted amidohydrolase YtcJ
MVVFENLRFFDGERFVRGQIAAGRGLITAVGKRLWGKGERRDLDHAYVASAFNDCHCHISTLAESFSMVDVGPEECPTVEAALAALTGFADEHPYRSWIIGHRFAQAAVAERRYPTRAELDAVAPGRAVCVWHASRHGIIANSKALEIAGIGLDTPDPPGGRIDRDPSGWPTGALFENATILLRRCTPRMGREELSDNLLRAAAHLNSMGITAATDASSFQFGREDEIWAYERATEEGMALRVRLTPLLGLLREEGGVPLTDEWDPWPSHPSLAIGGVKLFSDGAIGTRTAAVSGGFQDAESGMLIHDDEELAAQVLDVHRAGRQALVHAIGDRAVESALGAFEAAQAQIPRFEARHRVEHAMVLTPELIQRLAASETVVALQPEFLRHFGEDYIRALGDRALRVKPFRSLVEAGVPFGFGSDLPIVPGSPGDGLLAAVTRRTAKETQFEETESLTPAEALRAYTAGSAYAGFQEHELGSVAPGFRADFVLFRYNPLEVLAAGAAPTPTATIFDGETVWTG